MPAQRFNCRAIFSLEPETRGLQAWEMVEGPGCTLNGEKIRAEVCPGQAVMEVRGSALQSLGDPRLPHAASAAAVSSQVSRSYNLAMGQQEKM